MRKPTGSITYLVGKQSFVYLVFTMHTGAIGKSVNKQRIVCDKIAESKYTFGHKVIKLFHAGISIFKSRKIFMIS